MPARWPASVSACSSDRASTKCPPSLSGGADVTIVMTAIGPHEPTRFPRLAAGTGMVHYRLVTPAAPLGPALQSPIVADTPKPPPSAVRQALMWAIKIGVSAILLYVLFSRIDTAEL